jgi:hypothetical protein
MSAGGSTVLEEDIRQKFGLKSPGKQRLTIGKENTICKGNISLYWTWDKGEPGVKELGGIYDLRVPLVGIFKLKYSLLLVLTEDKRALVYGKNYDANGNFAPVVMTSTDLNRYLGRSDKILEACICNKEFLLIKYQPNGMATMLNFEDLENGKEEKPPIYHFVMFRISKLAKLMKIDDSWEKMEEKDGIEPKY